jgi:opacity protein-like surface antigen
MRRLLTFAMLAALALPAASAARSRAPSDGTLSVRDARGTITILARGGVIGSFARGSVTINDPVEGDGTGPVVTGEAWSKERDSTTTTWGGAKVRFRIIGGSFRIVVRGRGINLSLVGKGNVTLAGAGTGVDGSYSVNGGEYLAMPGFSFAFPLSATSP